MTVHNVVNGCRARNLAAPCRIGSTQARQILAATPETAGVHRRDACGSRRRLQALVALGHSPAHLARQIGISPPRMRRLLHGQTQAVSSATHLTICKLYSQLWNKMPAERTQQEQVTAEVTRRQAQKLGWPPPMALDDHKVDDPKYRPEAAWRQATA
jgi:hypothetical protein